MSGSPVIRFRLKPELVALLEARGKSASHVAKQIVLDDLKRGPIPADLLPAIEATDREDAVSPEVAHQIRDLADAPAPGVLGTDQCDCIWDLPATYPACPHDNRGPEGVEGPTGEDEVDLLDEAIVAAQEQQEEKSGISLVVEERPSPFASIAPRLGAEPPPKPEAEAHGDPGDENDALLAQWRTLMRTDPGLAIDIGTFDEFKRRREASAS